MQTVCNRFGRVASENLLYCPIRHAAAASQHKQNFGNDKAVEVKEF